MIANLFFEINLSTKPDQSTVPRTCLKQVNSVQKYNLKLVKLFSDLLI